MSTAVVVFAFALVKSDMRIPHADFTIDFSVFAAGLI
jgi:hypothetical protein